MIHAWGREDRIRWCLRETQRRTGLTLDGVAARLTQRGLESTNGGPITRRTLHRWASGEVRIALDHTLELARLAGVDPAWLAWGIEPGRSAMPVPGAA